ncbi:MAG TPA: glycosyltransferase [Gemmatimonadales bacterium]|nr:glycosyltransferase [Gemmatimonadales bacterium]
MRGGAASLAPSAPPEHSSSAPATAPLRIALVLESSMWGGMEMHTLQLAQVLTRRGHHVLIVEVGEPVFDGSEALRGTGIELLNVRLDREPDEVGLLRWYTLFRSLRADIGVSAKGWFLSGSARLELAARAAFPRFVTIEHVTPPSPNDRRPPKRYLGGLITGPGIYRIRRWLNRRIRRLAPHRVIGVSRAVIDQLHKEYGFDPRKLVAVPNGINCDQFRPDPAWRAASRARWGVPEQAIVIGTVGRLDIVHKGQDLALDLLAELRGRHPGVPLYYVLVGDGPDRERLAQQAAALGIAEYVIFAGGTATPWESYPGFDIFALPSRFEGGPFTLMEAMASGCCAVAMRVGAVNDIIPDRSVGWNVPAGSRDEFLAAMEAAVNAGAAQRCAIGERARQHVLRHFQAEQQYAAVADMVLRP